MQSYLRFKLYQFLFEESNISAVSVRDARKFPCVEPCATCLREKDSKCSIMNTRMMHDCRIQDVDSIGRAQLSPVYLSKLCVCSRDGICSERRGDVCIDCNVIGIWANAPTDEPA